MKLIITTSIKKTEFEPLKISFPIESIKIAAKKSLEQLGEKIKGNKKIPHTSLSKVYLTSTANAGRAVFLLQLSSQKTVLVMIKLKKDKKIGTNMTVQNPKFKKLLEKNLDSIMKDLENKNYEEHDL